ncbi:MAG: AI-2E family transporter [Leptolyngbyaceae cyanobacterium]
MTRPSQNDFLRSLSNSSMLRFLLLFACGWAIVQLIAYFYTIIAIFTIAAILAILMDYPTRFLARFMPRGLAMALTILVMLGLTIAFVSLLGLQILTQGQGLLSSISTTLQTNDLPFHKLLDQLNIEQVARVLQNSLGTGLGVLGGLFSNTFTAIFTFVIAIYMLVDGRKIWSACLNLLPVGIRERFDYEVQKNFLGFLRAQASIVVFLTIASFIVYSLLQVKYALILALVIGVLDAIPGIGATLAVVIVTLLVFLAQGQWMALKVLIASLILQQIQDNLINPKLMGKTLEINPVLLFFSLFIGERIAGLLGVFLAIPIAGIVVSWYKSQTGAEKLRASPHEVALPPTTEGDPEAAISQAKDG